MPYRILNKVNLEEKGKKEGGMGIFTSKKTRKCSDLGDCS